ncbi:hypothetical protein JR316_0010335 [Psilocybe cubensis]|uniref:Uncharacterized protein n=1 Tax=Psilocybe cubensis TaxID=181762 RepID=A0ACB8GRQ1_PSICU|nr:hypothetical protein JR316_0010335 [Psilocybe cubensis]KAH9478097.1 hypothetical protein JR316_0010335 [Psilocybe cubensis]
MSTSDVPFSIPTRVQISVISGTLNSVVVFAILTGVYSIVYVGTMYFYITRRRATKSRMFAVQWYYLNLAIIENGDTRVSIFISALTRGSVTVYAVTQTAFCMMFIVSDALLICYQVWGQSVRVTVLPVALIMAETGYRINKVSNMDGANRSSSARFSHIIKVLIESAAVYLFIILVYAIQAAIPISSESLIKSPLLLEGYYLQTVITAVSVRSGSNFDCDKNCINVWKKQNYS